MIINISKINRKYTSTIFFITASVVNISQIIGSVFTGSLAGMFGRKRVILLSSIFMIIGWTVIGVSDGSFPLLITGRLIHGGFFLSSVSQVYLAEISDSVRRFNNFFNNK
jgi:MFS family permease